MKMKMEDWNERLLEIVVSMCVDIGNSIESSALKSV